MATFNDPRRSLSNGAPDNGHHLSSQQDLASSSLDLDDPSEGPFLVPVHGSCPRCHHLHTNAPLALSRNPSIHIRFGCEICGHQIFGIGRSSTQTTLASMETLGVRITPESPRAPVQSCINRSSLRIEPVADSERDNALEPLSTISEANTPPGRSRSTSNAGPPEPPSIRYADPQLSSTPGLEDPLQRRITGHNSDQNIFRNGENRAKRSLKRLHGIMAWAKNRLRNKWPNSRTQGETNQAQEGFLIPANSNLNSQGRYQGSASRIHDNVGASEVPYTENPQQPFNIAHGTSPAPAHATTVTEGLPRFPSLYGSDDEQPSLTNPAVAEDELEVQRKQQRVRAKRRQETLERRVAERPSCLCTTDCHCMQGNGASDPSSGDHQSSSLIIQVPDHPLGHLLRHSPLSSESQSSHPSTGISLVEIGSHLYPDPRPSSSEGNSSTVAESSRTPSRLSQRTAVDDGTSSSRSRPASLGRSSSVPVIQHRDRGGFYHPTPRDLLRRFETREQLRRSVREGEIPTSRPPTRDGTDLSTADSTESSQGLHIRNHVGSTNLANLPDPGPHGMPATPPSRFSPTGNSQEMTPRPHSLSTSGNLLTQPAQVPPETLSAALEELADGSSEDHSTSE